MRADTSKLKTFPPVSCWELIDAISKLHIINDCPNQIGIIINNLENRCCSQLTKAGQNNCQYSLCGSLFDLTKAQNVKS